MLLWNFINFWDCFMHKIILSVKLIRYPTAINFLIFKLKFVSKDNKKVKNREWLQSFQNLWISSTSDFPLRNSLETRIGSRLNTCSPSVPIKTSFSIFLLEFLLKFPSIVLSLYLTYFYISFSSWLR